MELVQRIAEFAQEYGVQVFLVICGAILFYMSLKPADEDGVISWTDTLKSFIGASFVLDGLDFALSGDALGIMRSITGLLVAASLVAVVYEWIHKNHRRRLRVTSFLLVGIVNLFVILITWGYL